MVLGQTMGAQLGRVLTGRANDPLLIESVERDGVTGLLVRFGGVEGVLVEDPIAFTATTGLSAPANFGFSLLPLDDSGASPDAVSAHIIGPDTIKLVFDHDLDGAWRLSLGLHGQDLSDSLPDAAFESYNGTTLRDSATLAPFVLPETGFEEPHELLDFAPIQTFDFWA